jgi:hypothetical protein
VFGSDRIGRLQDSAVTYRSKCIICFYVGGVLDAFTEFRKAAFSFDMSVCPHGTTRLPLDRFSSNLILEDFSKICREIQI